MDKINIGSKLVSDNEPTFIIAEAGSNHNGDINQAKELIDIAAEACVDAVKFQTFTADTLFKKGCEAHKIVENYELPLEWHKELKKYADTKGLIFMTTPFYPEAVELSEKINLEAYKVASSDLTYYPLLELVAATNKPIILSTGISHLYEIEEAVNRIYNKGNERVILMHCVSNYPTDPDNVNLHIIDTLKKEFDLPVGFSDHTTGIEIPLAAVALGANVIEKHFTISRNMEGMDHFYALEPDELKDMVDGIRRVEKALGSEEKKPVKKEIPEAYFARRGIYASKNIEAGHKIKLENLKFVRPVDGIGVENYDIVIGKIAAKDIKKGQAINWDVLR